MLLHLTFVFTFQSQFSRLNARHVPSAWYFCLWERAIRKQVYCSFSFMHRCLVVWSIGGLFHPQTDLLTFIFLFLFLFWSFHKLICIVLLSATQPVERDRMFRDSLPTSRIVSEFMHAPGRWSYNRVHNLTFQVAQKCKNFFSRLKMLHFLLFPRKILLTVCLEEYEYRISWVGSRCCVLTQTLIIIPVPLKSVNVLI